MLLKKFKNPAIGLVDETVRCSASEKERSCSRLDLSGLDLIEGSKKTSSKMNISMEFFVRYLVFVKECGGSKTSKLNNKHQHRISTFRN